MSPAVTRSALLLLVLVLASCTSEAAPPICPGEEVARLSFAFEPASGPLADGLDPEVNVTDCPASLAAPEPGRFAATLSAEPGGTAGALCRSTGAIMYGTRTGSRWEVALGSAGAVLAPCGATCAARSDQSIRGDVAPDPDAPTSFTGALVERFSRTDGECGSCPLPCAVRYDLTGSAEAQP
jgi:hypothetical protein